MYQKLIIDTTITGIAFFVSGIIGLIALPLMLKAYGVYVLGLIVSARAFLPTGFAGILDFGISEISSQIIAAARVDNEWPRASARLLALLISAALIGCVVSAAIYSLSPHILKWIDVAPNLQKEFELCLYWIAILNPLLFILICLEGVLKGFEKFLLLRSLETLWLSAHFIAIVLITSFQASYYLIILSLVLCNTIKGICLGFVSWRLFPHLVIILPSKSDIIFIKDKAGLLLFSRVLGNLQHQLPIIVMASLFGPAAVGIYETVTRLPRFLKSALGTLAAVVIPTAAKLDAIGHDDEMKNLGVILAVVFPSLLLSLIIPAAIFSQEILYLWVGPDLVPYSHWMSIFLLVPLINTILSFQNSILLGRNSYLYKNNKISCMQTIVQWFLSLFLTWPFAQFGFIAGQVIASMVFGAPALLLGNNELGYPKTQMKRMIVALALATPITAWVFISKSSMQIDFLDLLLLYSTMGFGIFVLASLFFVSEKNAFRAIRSFVIMKRLNK